MLAPSLLKQRTEQPTMLERGTPEMDVRSETPAPWQRAHSPCVTERCWLPTHGLGLLRSSGTWVAPLSPVYAGGPSPSVLRPGGYAVMQTIVTYTDAHPPLNDFPRCIVSPTRPSPCCLAHMEEVGGPQREDHREYVYRRCWRCGFTVRVIVHAPPHPTDIARLHKLFGPRRVR